MAREYAEDGRKDGRLVQEREGEGHGATSHLGGHGRQLGRLSGLLDVLAGRVHIEEAMS